MGLKYHIGNLTLKNRFFLAPMLEPNDLAFRMLCKKAGAALTYTGMINPLSKQKINFEDKPAIQIFCIDTEGLESFIKKYDSKVSLWDLNLGCPSKLAGNLGFGSFLQEDLEKIKQILKIMRDSTKKPVTIKLRKSKQAIKIAKLAQEIGIDAIGIHPRTKEQGYSGDPDINFAKKLKKEIRLPIIYSGNFNLDNKKEILDNFDFVFVGRAALGNPGIFSELLGKSNNISFKDYLNLSKLYGIPFRTIKLHAMNFSKHLPNAKEIRRGLMVAKNLRDIEKVFNL